MKTGRHRLKFAVLLFLPVLLYASISYQQSWLPYTLPTLPHSTYTTGFVTSFLWTDGGKSLLISADYDVYKWDVKKKALTHFLSTKAMLSDMALSPTDILACQVEGEESHPCVYNLHLWNIRQKRRLKILQWSGPCIFSPNGHQLTMVAETVGSYDSKGTCLLLNTVALPSLRVLKTVRVALPHGTYLRPHAGPSGNGGTCGGYYVPNIVLSPDGKWGAISLFRDDTKAVYSGFWWKPSVLYTFLFFNAQTGKHVSIITLHRTPYVEAPMSLSADGSMLAVVDNQICRLWNTQSKQLKLTIKSASSFYEGQAIFSSDNTLLALAGDKGTINLYSIPTGRLQRQLKTNFQSIGCLAFSPDDNTLATGSLEGTVKLWRIK